ncbi:MAG: PilZ domain-containing protein [Deltaproteobacteria bacterium]|nr:PilZ domain-containing protein [Deltaproteobacteria bacterium]
MGLLNHMKSAFAKLKDRDAATVKALSAIEREGRLHMRVPIPNALNGIVNLMDSGQSGRLNNLSYGGLATTIDDHTLSLATGKEYDLQLSLLESSIQLKARLIRATMLASTQTQLAFSLVHAEAASLIFLRDYIEPLREGRSMLLIPTEVRKDRYQGSEWHCFRGDRASDLILRLVPDGRALAELLLTFPWQEGYCQVIYQDGRLATGVISGPTSSTELGTALARSSVNPDPAITRAALCIMASVPGTYDTLLAPIFTHLHAASIK